MVKGTPGGQRWALTKLRQENLVATATLGAVDANRADNFAEPIAGRPNDVVIADYNYGLVVLYHNKPAGVTAAPATAAALKSGPARDRSSSPLYSGTRLRR